jgi:hypothetical protein
MPIRTLDLTTFREPNGLAQAIGDRYTVWKNGRSEAEARSAEVERFIFATDTSSTSAGSLPWKNKTHRPKLCQIRDNLHANYFAALFPQDRWFKWQAGDNSSGSIAVREGIEAYMNHVLKASNFEEIISRCLLDWIDTGNCFADVSYVHNQTEVPGTTVKTTVYSGPQIVRISPRDILFDITAPSFRAAPKITRSLLTLGQLEKYRTSLPEWSAVTNEIMAYIVDSREKVRQAGRANIQKADLQKAQSLTASGYASLFDYYSTDFVEVLEFEGDLYDTETRTLYENHVITVVDRCHVVRREPARNWFGTSTKVHCGWRLRPDNLMAMGPLDNLVGLQYRIDHLENLKSDVFDLIAFPVQKVKGMVEDYIYQPNEQIFMEQDADVEFMRPDTTALNADLQIERLEQTMEEMAGAPKQAMGIRTPGEKTAFEVQALENASYRIFQNKIAYFEKVFVEPLLNAYLECARRNMNAPEIVRVVDGDLGVETFQQITRDNLMAKGKLVPMGARHFAAAATLVQNLTNLSQSGIYQDPAVNIHLSGKKIAELMEDQLGLQRFHIFTPNIRIMEQTETQNIMNQSQEEVAMVGSTDITTPTEVPDDEEDGGDPSAPPDSGMV